jgi:hypothetical protein
MRRLGVLAVAMVGAVLLGACTSTGDGGGGASPTTSTATPPAGSPTVLPTVEPTGGPAWTTGPLKVTRDYPVPPVPLLVGIRSAAHADAGFDRIVFDFAGPLPGYAIRYVDEVRADPSDQPVTMPGRRYLLIVFTVAQAHTEAGETSVSPRSMTLDYSMLRGYAVVGDFEGYVSVALGLDDVVGFRVGELASPNRIYVDVAA